VHDLILLIFPLEMGNLERFDSLERQIERLPRRAAFSASQILLYLPQRTQHARTIESLTFTVIAIAHRFIHRNQISTP
jgi:hypothetical protein